MKEIKNEKRVFENRDEYYHLKKNFVLKEEYTKSFNNIFFCILKLKNGQDITGIYRADNNEDSSNNESFDSEAIKKARINAYENLSLYERYRIATEKSNILFRNITRMTEDKEGNPLKIKKTDIVNIYIENFNNFVSKIKIVKNDGKEDEFFAKVFTGVKNTRKKKIDEETSKEDSTKEE